MSDGMLLFVVIVFCTGSFIGLLTGLAVGMSDWARLRKDAVKRGHAQYSPTTGIWEWKP